MGEDLPPGVTRESLRERVGMLRPGIVLYREHARFDARTVSVMSERVQELVAEMDRYDMVVDLTGVRRPNPETMGKVRSLVNDDTKLRRLYFVIGKSTMLRVGLKFINAAIRDKTITAHTTMQDVEREIDGAQD
jgi:hypothetical protein